MRVIRVLRPHGQPSRIAMCLVSMVQIISDLVCPSGTVRSAYLKDTKVTVHALGIGGMVDWYH